MTKYERGKSYHMTEVKRGMVFRCLAVSFGDYDKLYRVLSASLDKPYVLAYDINKDRRYAKRLPKTHFEVLGFYKRVE